MFCKHHWAGGRRNRREKVVSASSGKLAGKSQAGLKFSASGVPVTVLEAQEDKSITNHHVDSHKHCPPCTVRKLLFPVTLPAESLRANRKSLQLF